MALSHAPSHRRKPLVAPAFQLFFFRANLDSISPTTPVADTPYAIFFPAFSSVRFIVRFDQFLLFC
jgi:hypothetical protein